ncbi:MAG: chromate resistance protein ChrB domain-containing protein [Pseudomonadota bacterium]
MPAPNLITPSQLSRLLGTPEMPCLLDVCLPEDFTEDPRVIPTARRLGFERVEDIAADLQGQRVVIICQKGKKLSQGAAALLRTHGVAAEALQGGIIGWRDAGLPLIPAAALPAPGSLWVTRHRPKVDRIACPWLIRRFIDPAARFLYVAPSEVLNVAEKFGAISFDTEGAAFAHQEGHCTFDAFLDGYSLSLPGLDRMAEVIRAADGTPGAQSDQAPGLLAISLGLSRMFKDDLQQLEAALPLYDALYRWARDAQDETHDWDAHEGGA